MDALQLALEQSLRKGFIDQIIPSKNEYLPQFLINDKSTGKKVLSTILDELHKCDEFWFSVAFVTTNGIATLINTFDILEQKGIKGKILVSQYLNFTQPEALKRLLQFKNIELKIAVNSDFHSKGYLFKNGKIYDLIIGSSNLTANALCTNKEWNLKISATPISDIIINAVIEFTGEFQSAKIVNDDFISKYELLYKEQFRVSQLLTKEFKKIDNKEIYPNSMQVDALANIARLRKEGKNKALLISATGTGKTYLSAFDAKEFRPKKFLFLVHRTNIAVAAMEAYKDVFGKEVKMGIYSGNRRELDSNFIFSTIQTISRDENLQKFDSSHFNYIVIDETHRAGADSYTKILNYFKPEFLLGMTATPERTDGLDIFKLYDHNIAYEIRLHKALEEDMLSTFHYYGISDISINGELLNELADFNILTSQERLERIIEKTKFYGCDNGIVRGLVFCSKVEECKALSNGFNQLGYKTVALTGENSEEDRSRAINKLESENEGENLDYIFTVDIFNEGIDIPRVNQVIMLRPTQSAIIFVQQLGRGLRKTKNKEYLTVIDFIGNYNKNYLVPIALYGDTSYNKDTLRKCLSSGSALIPGSSTINFDKISRDRIFKAIDSANMQMKKDLLHDYSLLKFKLGRIPLMIDFIKHGSRDPQLYVKYSKSYFNFVNEQEEKYRGKLNEYQQKILELFSNEINNSIRVEESIILSELINKGNISFKELKLKIFNQYDYDVSDETINSAIRNLNFQFVKVNQESKLISVHEKYGIIIVILNGNQISIHPEFLKNLQNPIFTEFLVDNTNYSIMSFNMQFNRKKFCDGFILYRKYSRKDVFRILNWESNPVAQNVGGYIVSDKKDNCPIFVTYHKEENISSTTKYEDSFISNVEFKYMSKSKRKLSSPDVQSIMNYRSGLRLPLFIKKNNDEGSEFYFISDVTPIDDSFIETTMPDDKGKKVSVVKMRFHINHSVEDSIYNYIANDHRY